MGNGCDDDTLLTTPEGWRPRGLTAERKRGDSYLRENDKLRDQVDRLTRERDAAIEWIATEVPCYSAMPRSIANRMVKGYLEERASRS